MKPDENGYYHVVLGKYPSPIAEGVFEAFQKRCRSGQVHAEYGSPKRLPHQHIDDYINRMKVIDIDKAAAQIADVKLSEDGQLVIGTIKPVPPFGPLVEHHMNGRPEDTQFSVGVFGYRGYKRNGEHTEIFTFDYIKPE